MQKNTFSTFQAEPPFVFVLYDAEIGPARVLVPAGASVEYEVFYVAQLGCYVLAVWVGGQFAGWHCGDRSGDVIAFGRESDAVRLAGVRNAAWKDRTGANGRVARPIAPLDAGPLTPVR
jgi:hypothetical protein